jgi:putative ABC transport system substrate-binding protein
MNKNKNNRIKGWIGSACILLCSHVLCAPLTVEANITVLMSSDSAPYQAMREGFQGYLRDNGVQADYEVLQIGKDNSEAGQLAGKIAQQDPALIYCLGSRACQAVQQMAGQRPVVASMLLTPESITVAAQATGVFLNYSPQTQLQWLKKLFPDIHRVGVIYNPAQNQALIDKATKTARQLGLELVAAPVNAPKELPAALKNLLHDIDILWALPDRMVLAPQSAKEILLTSFRNRIPVIGASAPWVKSGALYALDWDYADLGAQNAAMALEVIKGTPINKIPATEPRSVAYTLNLKTAEHMKLDMPAEISRGAKHVYQ